MQVILIAHKQAVQDHERLRKLMQNSNICEQTCPGNGVQYQLLILRIDSQSVTIQVKGNNICVDSNCWRLNSPVLVLAFHVEESQIQRVVFDIEEQSVCFTYENDVSMLQYDLEGNWDTVSENPLILFAAARMTGVNEILDRFSKCDLEQLECDLEQLEKLRRLLLDDVAGGSP